MTALALAWASVAVLACLGLHAIRRDPAHPTAILIATGIAWTALATALAVIR